MLIVGQHRQQTSREHSHPVLPGRRQWFTRLPKFILDTEIPTIVWTILRALYVRLTDRRPRLRPQNPKRILIVDHLFLGDTLLLTPLIAKLCERYPKAEIVLTAPIPIAPLYAGNPYGVKVWPFGLRKVETIVSMFEQDGFDLAIVPGENRHRWLAVALRSRWIVAHASDRPVYRNWMIDELIPYPTTTTAMGDIFAQLIPGEAPQAYRQSDWPAPNCQDFELPARRYAVLHVGGRSPLKYWEADKWRLLARWLGERSVEVVWSGGANDAALVKQIDPDCRYRSYAGQLDLAQLWRLIAAASVFVSPDTGVAHLSRLTGTPTVTLFGPGSDLMFGRGDFWRNMPCEEVTIRDFPCRDQQTMFRREVSWIRNCGRFPSECSTPRCMQAIGTDPVINAVERLLDPPC